MEADEILDTSVAIHRDSGAVTVFSAIEYTPSLKKFEIIFPEIRDYTKAINIAEELRVNGKPIGAIDILISAMCLNRSAKLITKDNDFRFIKEIFPEFNLNIIKS